MSCGLSHGVARKTRQFVEAVACGQKFENPHFQHYCMICGNRDTEKCLAECLHGPVCHFTQENPKQIRETVAAVLLAVQDAEGDMAKRREPAEIGVSTGPFMKG